MNEEQPFITWPVIGGFVAGFLVAFMLFAMGAVAAKLDRLTKVPSRESTGAVTVTVAID